jgi:biopolymer transport protein ExbD
MADMIVPQKGGRRRVQTPRIDFTPMVDLGFILITFFIYTTTIAKSGTLVINMPQHEPDVETVYADESTITLLPYQDHKVAYYSGALNSPGQIKVTSTAAVKEMLIANKKRVASLPASMSEQAHKLHVIIKPHETCKYEDVVHLMDDMVVEKVPYYTLVDITAPESDWVGAHK